MNAWRAAAAALALCGASCASAAADDVTARWTLTPATPAVGEHADARLELHQGARHLQGARITLEAHMAHPGMAPLVARTGERDGVYEARLQFTMKGTWVVVAAGTLPDGRRLTRELGTIGVSE